VASAVIVMVFVFWVQDAASMGTPYNDPTEFPEGTCQTIASTVLVEKRKSEFIFSSEVTLSTIQFERASYFM
jgi:hypothetical protein